MRSLFEEIKEQQQDRSIFLDGLKFPFVINFDETSVFLKSNDVYVDNEEDVEKYIKAAKEIIKLMLMDYFNNPCGNTLIECLKDRVSYLHDGGFRVTFGVKGDGNHFECYYAFLYKNLGELVVKSYKDTGKGINNDSYISLFYKHFMCGNLQAIFAFDDLQPSTGFSIYYNNWVDLETPHEHSHEVWFDNSIMGYIQDVQIEVCGNPKVVPKITIERILVGKSYFEFKGLVPICNLEDELFDIVLKSDKTGSHYVNIYKNGVMVSMLQEVKIRISSQKIPSAGRNIKIDLLSKKKNEKGEWIDYLETYVNKVYTRKNWDSSMCGKEISSEEFVVPIVIEMISEGAKEKDIIKSIKDVEPELTDDVIRDIIVEVINMEQARKKDVDYVQPNDSVFKSKYWDD